MSGRNTQGRKIEMTLYTITHSVDGVTFVRHIVSKNILRAVEISCSLLQDYVGSNFKEKMLSGRYITNIGIMGIHYVDAGQD